MRPRILGDVSTVDAKPFRWAARAGAIAAIVVVAGCASAPGTATYIWVVRGGINGRFEVRPAELACDLYYDPVGYGTGPVIPTFSLGTKRFFQVREGENQAYVTFALKLGGFRGPGTYPLSVRRGRRVRRDLQRLAV